MNIVLFEKDELERRFLPMGDARAAHALRVLRRQVGDCFDAGVVDGPKGKARVEAIGEAGIELSFEWGAEELPLLPIDLIVGMSRPQTMRKVLHEATTLGVRSIRFVATERGEPSYAESRLWSSGEWRRHVVAGAAQAFATRLPQVAWGMSLGEGASVADSRALRVALDNYEGTVRLGRALSVGATEVLLAVGSERGWTGAERNLLRGRGFVLAGLGERVLRTETAVVAAVSVAREAMGV